jgi:hypothetical protein
VRSIPLLTSIAGASPDLGETFGYAQYHRQAAERDAVQSGIDKVIGGNRGIFRAEGQTLQSIDRQIRAATAHKILAIQPWTVSDPC